MNRLQAFISLRYKILLLLICCIAISLFSGYYYGKQTVEAEFQALADNVYGGRYHVELDFTGPDGMKDSIKLNCSAFRFPTHDSNGKQHIRTGSPFIEQKSVSYDIFYFALTDGNASRGFDFTFVDCPPPDNIAVQCWPREQQGAGGTFTNGTPLEFDETSEPMKYHVSEFKPGYIYSIYASWGPYYAEFACLASDDANERVYWELEG